MRNQWPEKNLGECCIDKPSYGANAPSVEYQKDLPRYLRITDIDDYGNLIESDPKSIELKAAEGNYLERGDIVFARSGATVGKTYLHRNTETLAYAGYLIRFRPNQNVILPEYLFLFTQSDHYKTWIKNNLRAGAQPNINAQEYSSLRLPLPPLPEQRKIAAILRTWDEGIEKLEKLKNQIHKKYKFLLADIFSDTSNKAPYFIGDICSPKQWPTISQEQLQETGFPVFGANGYLGFYMEANHQFDTIAVTCRGATCGEINWVPGPSYITGNAMCLDDIDTTKIQARYLWHLLKFKGVKEIISGSAQPQIIGSDIRRVKIFIHSIHKQDKLVELLDQQLNELSLLDRSSKILSHQKRGLMQKLLTGKWRVKI